MRNTAKKPLASLLPLLIGLSLVLGACGEASPTARPTTTTAASATTSNPATTAATATTITAVTTAADPTTLAATTAIPATTAVPTTAAPTTAAASAAPTTIAAVANPVGATWAKESVCYEVFVRSFYDSNGDGKGDLNGLIAKLDYINDGQVGSTKSLGANCIWLMPVTASPSYHGYDTTDYYKVNPDYGTNDDFKKFMAEAHKRGIHVLIDLVLNHTSNQHEWFKAAAADPKSPYRDYYIFSETDPGYAGPEGAPAWFKNPSGPGYYYAAFDSALPDLNYKNPAVTKQAQDVTRFWLQEMGVDGFRLDAIKHLIEDGAANQVDTPQTHDWLRDFRKFYTGIKKDAFTVGEVFAPSSLKEYYPDQLDYYFEFNVAQGMVNSANRGINTFVGQIKIADTNWPVQRYASFLTNHDQTRIGTVVGGDVNKLKLAATELLTTPGLPFIYYGEELGMQGAKPDPNIRTPMQWTSDPATGGFTTGQPYKALQSDTAKINVGTEDADTASLLNLYRALIRLRRSNVALAQGSFLTTNTSYGVVAYLRQSGAETVLVVLNTTDEAKTDLQISVDKSDLPPGQYSPAELLAVNTDGKTTLAPLTVGPGGAFTDYAPVASLPARSAYIIAVKK